MKYAYLAILAATLPGALFAQSAIDAQQISQSDFKGTARFMSMGGAFTALGGDLSTLNQNPAGIGIYRSNEIGATLDINFQSTNTSPSYAPDFPSNNSQTKAYCNNFGYVGATRIPNSALQTFNWGVTYNRAVSFDRVYQGYGLQNGSSLSNYIAAYTTANGTPSSDMDFTDKYNPYYDSTADWLSILAYNSYLINPSGNGYIGLADENTTGDMLYQVRESGYVDEYNISFGGNVENLVYWGLSIGITDLNYARYVYYSESMANAYIPKDKDHPELTNGSAMFDISTPKYINGTGWNMKFGVILKPTNELRFGLAVHTPTWYSLSQGYNADAVSSFTPTTFDGTINGKEWKTDDYTENASFNWRCSQPWKIMAGVAGVIGGKAIVSLDYEYKGFGDMRASTPVYYNNYPSGYESAPYINDAVKTYFKGANTIRLGAEYRVTPQFSVRAGYNVTTSNVKEQAANGSVEILTSGTDATYSFDKTTYHITAGLGYRYQAWYIDAAYVYKNRESTFHAYTNFGNVVAPQSKIIDHNSSIVLSTGFKF